MWCERCLLVQKKRKRQQWQRAVLGNKPLRVLEIVLTYMTEFLYSPKDPNLISVVVSGSLIRIRSVHVRCARSSREYNAIDRRK